MTDEAPKRRPSHETIVQAIENAGRTRLSGLAILAMFIKETDIPENHDAIIAAWKREALHFGNFDSVLADLIKQKEWAARKAEEAQREDSKAATIGRYLLGAIELTDEVVDRIWDALPGDARVAIQTKQLAELAAQRAHAQREAVSP